MNGSDETAPGRGRAWTRFPDLGARSHIRVLPGRGTEGSNPAPSRGESSANLVFRAPNMNQHRTRDPSASIVIGRKAKARTLEGARPVLPEIEHERPSADLDHAPWRLPIRAASGDDESAPASNGTTIRKKAEPVPLPFRAARLLILAANDDPFKKWAPAGVLSRSDIGLGSQGSVECLQPQT
jgi:hypothetical protein